MDTHFAIDIEQRLENETQARIPFNFEEYQALVDWRSARGETYTLPVKPY
jgi:hypothetical protein